MDRVESDTAMSNIVGGNRARVDLAQVGRSGTGGNPYTENCEYGRYRPEYSKMAVMDALIPYHLGENWQNAVCLQRQTRHLELLRRIWGSTPKVFDIGAGSGKYTQAITNLGVSVEAVEPAVNMAVEFAKTLPGIPIHQVKAEEIGDVVQGKPQLLSYAQCWHWLDSAKASAAAAEVLDPQGQIAIIFNQLNVSFPWVKRLSRVMRSGDVHFPNRPPKLGPEFCKPILRLRQWSIPMTLNSIYELGKTRSSYLRATVAGREHLENNLRYFLETEMQLYPQQSVTIPYYTLTWVAKLR